MKIGAQLIVVGSHGAGVVALLARAITQQGQLVERNPAPLPHARHAEFSNASAGRSWDNGSHATAPGSSRRPWAFPWRDVDRDLDDAALGMV